MSCVIDNFEMALAILCWLKKIHILLCQHIVAIDVGDGPLVCLEAICVPKDANQFCCFRKIQVDLGLRPTSRALRQRLLCISTAFR